MLQSITFIWMTLAFAVGALLGYALMVIRALRGDKNTQSELIVLRQQHAQIQEQLQKTHQKNMDDETRIQNFMIENAKQQQQISTFKQILEQKQLESDHLADNYKKLQQEYHLYQTEKESALATFKSQIGYAEQMRQEFTQMQQEHGQILKQKQQLEQGVHSLEQANLYLQQQADHKELEYQKMQKNFTEQFENLAHKIFEEKNRTFTEQSSMTLAHVLEPMKQSFSEFKQKIDDNFSKHRDEQLSLKQSIHHIVMKSEEMSKQTENLTKALKGDNKIQGNWGEMILERLLEETGLIKDRDYTIQATGLKLVHDETQKQQRPDVIVHLPDDKHIIIDSKVSLVDYERFIAAETLEEQAIARKSFLDSIKRHVTDLSSKAYQDNDTMNTPDFVLMFIPIEGAYNFAIHEATDLHEYAWKKRIILVCTSTLFATLRTVASLWRLEKQNRHALDIAIQAGKMYDKLYGFLTDMEDLHKNLRRTQTSYDEAIKKLKDGRGNVLKQAFDLKQMGVKTSKNMNDLEVSKEALLLDA